MPFAELENFKLYYEMHGAGEPLVLIPGFASGAWIWFKQIHELAKSFQVITFDPRGVSRSKINVNLSDTVSVRSIADDIANLLTFLDFEKAHILGASFGGFVAQEFALNHPHRLNKLILVCTTAGGETHVKADLEVLRAFTPDQSLSLGEQIRKFMRPAFSQKFAETNADEIEKVCRMREENPVPETVYARQVAAAFAFDANARIKQIQAPTLVITGDTDLVVPAVNSANLAYKVPNARLEVMKDGSHLFFIERAAEFNHIVTSFINQ